VARSLNRRDLARVWSSCAWVAVILTESAERAFSNEAGEESSFWRRKGLLALADSHRREGRERRAPHLRPMAKTKPSSLQDPKKKRL
jgi:hypothetical protein